MKISLLTTAICVASQLKQAGDPEVQHLPAKSPSPSQDLLNKNPRVIARGSFPKRLIQFEPDGPKTASSKASAEGAPQPQKPPLPLTPASNPLAHCDYRKGDEATTFGEFKKALKGDYEVTCNKAAKNPEIFNKNPIMIYGERHDTPKIPSFRTPKGVLLLESDNPDRCVPKHKLHSSNRCVVIDKKRPLGLEAAIKDCAKKGKELVNLIDPKAMVQMEDKVWASSRETNALISEIYNFLVKSFGSAHAQASPRKKLLLDKAADAFQAAFELNLKVMKESITDRDKNMLMESEAAIKHLDPDASATIVVGSMHSDYLFENLSKKFPDRAVVLAKAL